MKWIEVRVYCKKCGHILEMSNPEVMSGTDITILVKPCENCEKEKDGNDENKSRS